MQINKIYLFLVVFLDFLAVGMVIPFLPFYTSRIGVTPSVYGLLMSFWGFLQFFAGPILGKYGDKHGRRIVLQYSFAASIISYFLLLFASNVYLLFLSRIPIGIFKQTYTISQTYLSDITTKEERTKYLSYLNTSFSLGFIFGPILGGLLYSINNDLPIYLSVVFFCVSLYITTFFLPESSSQSTTTEFSFSNFILYIKDPYWTKSMIIMTIFSISSITIRNSLILFAKTQFGYTEKETGILFSYIAILGVVNQGFILPFMIKKLTEAHLLFYSGIFLSISMISLTFSNSFYFIISLIPVNIFSGTISTCLTSGMTKRAKQNETGTLLGVLDALQSLVMIFVPLVVGVSFQWSVYLPFLISVLFVVIFTFVLEK